MQIPIRTALTGLGLAVWLLPMLVQTGGHGWAAFQGAVLFVAGLLVLSLATRTVGAREVLRLFFFGGLAMTVAWLLIRVYRSAWPAAPFSINVLFVPVLEEVLKLMPVFVILLRWRRATWTLGALDIMLLAAASGAGFGLVEEAYIRQRFPWPDVPSLPSLATLSSGRLIAGHALWSALAGLTLGLGLLFRTRGRWAYTLAASGLVWVVLDHMTTNYYSRRSDSPALLWRMTNGLGLDGYLTIVLLGLGLLFTILLEAWIVYRLLPRFVEFQLPLNAIRAKRIGWRDQIDALWRFASDRRRVAFLNFHLRLPHPAREANARMALTLAASLLSRHFVRPAPMRTEPATAE